MRFCLATPCCWLWSPSIFVHLWPTLWRYVGTLGRPVWENGYVNMACGLWGRKYIFTGSARDMVSAEGKISGCWADSSILAFCCLFFLSLSPWSGISCDGQLLFPLTLSTVFSRWAFPLKQTAPVVNTLVLISTVMRTSMPSSTVSCSHFLCSWVWRLPHWLGQLPIPIPNYFSLELGAEWI